MTSVVWWAIGLVVVLAIAAGGTWYFFTQQAGVGLKSGTSQVQQTGSPEQQQRAATLEQISASTSPNNSVSAQNQQARAQVLQQISTKQSTTSKSSSDTSASVPTPASQSERAALLNSLQAQKQ